MIIVVYQLKKKFENVRTCRICNQYIPLAYRMKNHYKIHAQHYEDFYHEQDDNLPTSDSMNLNEIQSATSVF